MKTLIACLIFAGIGSWVGYRINDDRYGHYETTFGPFDSAGDVTAEEAIAATRSSWLQKRPKIELPGGSKYDFGAMGYGEEGEHKFVVKNVGQVDLSLEVGAATCKCTMGSLEKSTLAPGEETEVTLSWTVKTNESTFGQSAELRTNDPDNVAVRLEISGQVVRQMQAVPETITFGEVAAGDAAEMEVRLYSYMDDEIAPGRVRFTSEEMNSLAEFDVEEFQPGPDDEIHADANQGFLIKAIVRPGLKQGPINQNLVFPFTKTTTKDSGTAKSNSELPDAAIANDEVLDEEDELSTFVSVTGRIVGVLSMLESTKLKGVAGGGYLYDFGSLSADDSLTAKAFVVLKGSEKENTTLSLGEVSPSEHLVATLAPPVGRGSMQLYSLELTLQPGDKPVERLGMNREDYGFVTIESDNPKVPALKLRVKFSIPGR